jgi:Polyketide cyclase / dehydrase and lipid transport.
MIEVSDTTRLVAPPSVVFGFLDDPHNHVRISPSLAGVESVEPLDNGGKRAEFVYSVAGVTLGGELVETTHEPDERMRFELRGQLSGRIDIALDPTDGGTRVTYSAAYELPGSVLGRVAGPLVRRYNKRELSAVLENLRVHVEDADTPNRL